ncbi:hypothetical protein AWM79_12730 [Pseudomonas agarici]|uniref:Uncharacterized protein n=1 Tax=Pseudomonas agarici TaxID=46677 RepID=A0A0X1T243_PSEAA|nr:hypothetical protein AWM79_12730 [Pseudomonas agarici]SEL40167.1 hypothetical protein SAMN05216604_11747 [Pseudomonas agarici]
MNASKCYRLETKTSNTETNLAIFLRRWLDKIIKSLILKSLQKLARHLLYLLHNKNKKQQTHKNKTYRL